MISREKSFGKGTFGLRHIVSFMQIMRLYPILTQKSGKGISLYYLMHNVQKLHGLINRARYHPFNHYGVDRNATADFIAYYL